jgi:hypothetical protein
MAEPMSAGRRRLLVLLVADAVLLALLELFFLPLRLDGTLLPKLGDFPMPITVVLAVITTPMLVSQTTKLVRPGLSWIPLLVWVLTLLVVGLGGPGGDVVLLPDWRTLLLLGGGLLPGAVALGGGLGRAEKGGKGG